jgi:hypothetical protein
MLLNKLLGFSNLFRLEPVIRVEFNGRFDPELRFTVSVLDMYMRPTFFSREEIKAEASNSKDCRTHVYRIPERSASSPIPARPATAPGLRPRQSAEMSAA